jgi:hypothetical protein
MLNQISFLELQRYASRLWPEKRLAIEPFSFPVLIQGLTEVNTITTTYKILANCDFVLTSVSTTLLGNAGILDNALLQIVDTGSQERLFNTAAPIGSFASLANPATCYSSSINLPGFRRYAGNSTLEITVTGGLNVPADPPVDFQLALHGALVYAYSS